MFYRMSRIHFDDSRFDELVAWAETVKPRVSDVAGLVFADIARTGPGEGMILAGYRSESDYEAVQGDVAELFEDMAQYLTDRPHTHAGTSDFSFVD